ncbi:MAG: NAD-dependent epimerase/dehydratase family protein [Acidimicrobiia bacterium]
MTSALVIGGAGFVGSHLVERLLADGVAVDVVDDLSTGSLANLAAARSMGGTLKIHHLDAASPEFASLIGMRSPDVVYHLAAVPRTDDAPTLSRSFAATAGLVDAARRHRTPKLVLIVPATVLYGRPANRDVPVKEGAVEPRGLRGVLARAAIDMCATIRESDAVEFTALAAATVYGPRQRPDGGVVAAFRAAAASGDVPRISGDGRQTRDFLFVDDAVDALVRAGQRGSGLVINIGTGEQTTIRDLWSAVAGAGAAAPQFVADRPDELHRFAVSPVRARIHLSWSSWTTLADGLAQLR